MKILFEGDSITDTGRNTDAGSTISIGQGYAMLIAAHLGANEPGKYTFENVGISGSRIVDVYARIKTDCWNRKPDVMSILIGVNDVWHEIFDAHNGVDAKRFYRVYKMLVEDTLERFPDMKLILMEPFVLNASATCENWDTFHSEVLLRAEAVQKIAEEFKQTFVPLQKKLDEMTKICPATYWLADGVHPAPAGHQIIANEWLKAFKTL